MGVAPATTSGVIQLTNDFRHLEDLLMASGGVITDEIRERMGALKVHEGDAAEQYVALCKDMEYSAKMWKAVAEEFMAKAKAAECAVKSVKEDVKVYFETANVDKIAGRHWGFYRQNNGGKCKCTVAVLPEQLPRELARITVEPDLEKIDEALDMADAARQIVAQRIEDPQERQEFLAAPLELIDPSDHERVLAVREPRGWHVRIR
jgi:hypothetical protein